MVLRLPLLVLAAVAFTLGCDEDPVLPPNGTTADASPPADGRVGDDGGMRDVRVNPPVADGEVDRGPWPDPDLFVATVQPILYEMCASPACHSRAQPVPSDSFFELVGDSPDGLSMAEIMVNFEEFQPRLVNYDQPAQSRALVYHPEGHRGHFLPGTRAYQAILDWINDALMPPEPDPGRPDGGLVDMGPAVPLPCDAFPEGPGLGQSLAFREAFTDPSEGPVWNGEQISLSDMLWTSCGESVCHGAPGAAGGLYLLDPGVSCGAVWNFFTVQWFVDPRSIPASPILSEPVNPGHGGREVFEGTADARYASLRRWLENGIAR